MRWWPCKATQHHIHVTSNIQNRCIRSMKTTMKDVEKHSKNTRQIPQPRASRQRHILKPCHFDTGVQDGRAKQKVSALVKRSRSLYIFLLTLTLNLALDPWRHPYISHPNYASIYLIQSLLPRVSSLFCVLCVLLVVFKEGLHVYTSFSLVMA